MTVQLEEIVIAGHLEQYVIVVLYELLMNYEKEKFYFIFLFPLFMWFTSDRPVDLYMVYRSIRVFHYFHQTREAHTSVSCSCSRPLRYYLCAAFENQCQILSLLEETNSCQCKKANQVDIYVMLNYSNSSNSM